MANLLATLALGPVLLAQGAYVRRTTPLLPEPPGPREGVIGAGPPLRLLIAGDSATAGVGATSQARALSGQLTAALAPHGRLSWRLLARTGWTAGELADALQAEPAEPFDVAIVAVGVNDVTGGTAPARWLAQQQRLADLLRQRHGVRHLVLAGVPPMQHFPALPQPLRWYLGQRAQRLNTALAGWVRNTEGCELAPLDLPVTPQLMAADGFHPGEAGYALWAAQLAALLRARSHLWAAG